MAEVDAAPRLRVPTTPVGRGANVRLVVPQPQNEQGLREAVRHQRGVRLRGDGALDSEAVSSYLRIYQTVSEEFFSESGLPVYWRSRKLFSPVPVPGDSLL